VDRTIIKIDDGEIVSRRRSPKHGQPQDVFGELVSFPGLLHSGLEVEIVLTHEEEVRVPTPGRSWRRHGWSVVERRLIEVVDAVLLSDPSALHQLVPDGLPDPFTTGDLASLLGRPRRAAQQMTYCLRRVGVFHQVGKAGNEVLYHHVSGDRTGG
jgi:hypothetical protein